MFIFEKFISCNGLKYRKIRSKSRGNNPLKLFKVCTGSLWCIFKSSAVTYNIGIMPGGTYEMTQFRIVCHGTDEDMRPKMHSFIPSKTVNSNMPSSPILPHGMTLVMLWGLGFGGEIQLKFTHSLVRQLIYALNLD